MIKTHLSPNTYHMHMFTGSVSKREITAFPDGGWRFSERATPYERHDADDFSKELTVVVRKLTESNLANKLMEQNERIRRREDAKITDLLTQMEDGVIAYIFDHDDIPDDLTEAIISTIQEIQLVTEERAQNDNATTSGKKDST